MFSCMCLHTSVCLCAVRFRLAVPTAILTAVDGVHLHSESQQLLPLLLHCCDSAPLAPAHIAAVPVMFGYSCAGELVADSQTANHELRPRPVSVGEFGRRHFCFCELPGSIGLSVLSFNQSQGSLLFLPASRWTPDDTLASVWHHRLAATAQLQKSTPPPDSVTVLLTCACGEGKMKLKIHPTLNTSLPPFSPCNPSFQPG